jgi:hypothetical protein
VIQVTSILSKSKLTAVSGKEDDIREKYSIRNKKAL